MKLKKLFCAMFMIIGTMLFILGVIFSQSDLNIGGNLALIGTFLFMIGLGILTFNSKKQIKEIILEPPITT